MSTPATTSGALQRFDKGSFTEFVKTNKEALKQVAHKGFDLTRLYRVTLTCIAQNQDLANCTTQSIFRAMQQSAELGLEPGGVLGEAYFVPFKNQCQFIVGYRGLVSLARRTGVIESIDAWAVYKGDEFEVMMGLEPVLWHKPKLGTRSPNDILHVYAVARLKGGGKQFDVMTRDEIDMIKSRSRAGGSGPWITDYAEMAKKTVIRRLCKMLPMSTQMAKAIEIDQADFGDEINISFANEPSPLDTDFTDGADQLALSR